MNNHGPVLAQPEFQSFLKDWLKHIQDQMSQASAAKKTRKARSPRPVSQAYLDIRKGRR